MSKNLLNNIIRKSIQNGYPIPGLIHDWKCGNLDSMKDLDVFDESELSYLKHTLPDEEQISKTFLSESGEIKIPEEVFNCIKDAQEDGYTPDGACMDWYYGTCFDYDYDFAVEKWLNSHGNSETTKEQLISQLYAQYILKNLGNKNVRK